MNVEKYLDNFFKGTKNPTLKAMEYLMEEFNHPENNLKIIHIAGTNGKGSCTEMMSNILIKAGYKVGKFISPHLIKYNERISIGNKNITDEEMEQLISKLEPKISQYNNLYNTKVTLFELITTMAILYFSQNNCDFVVLETGLGGLYDCTNIVKPIVSIITSIGYDHIQILGDTLEKIAKQKAGIIKENSNTVFVKQAEEEVNGVIEKECINKHNTLHLIENENILNYSYNQAFQKFDYKNYKQIAINLKGKKQIYNAAMCIECAEILKSKSYNIKDEALREGLKTVIHKARFETISTNPTIIYDGAHNKPAIENLINNINMYYKNDKKVYIISILKTKDYNSMLKQILKDEEAVFIFTTGNSSERYVAKEDLIETAKKYTNNVNLYAKDLNSAIDFAKQNYKNSIIFIIGSFYIYGTVINHLAL